MLDIVGIDESIACSHLNVSTVVSDLMNEAKKADASTIPRVPVN